MAQTSIAEATGQSLTREQEAFLTSLRERLGLGDAVGAAALLEDAAERGGRDATLYHIAAADLLAGRPEQRHQRLEHLRAAYAGAAGWQRDLEAAWNAAAVPDSRAVVALEQAVVLDPTDISRAELAVAEADRANALTLLAEAWNHLLMLDRSQAQRCTLELELRLDDPDGMLIEAVYETALRRAQQRERLMTWLTRRWERELAAPSVRSIGAGTELVGLHAEEGNAEQAGAIVRLLWHQTGVESAATSEALELLEQRLGGHPVTLLLLRQRAELLERWDEAVTRCCDEAEASESPSAAAQLLLHAAGLAVERGGLPGRAIAPLRRAVALDPGLRPRAATLLDAALAIAAGSERDELLADRRSLAGSLGDWETLHRLTLDRLPETTEPDARATLLLEIGDLEQRGQATNGHALARYVEAARLTSETAVRQQAIERIYRLLERPEVQGDAAAALVTLLVGPEERAARVGMLRFIADRCSEPGQRLELLLRIARELDEAGDPEAEAAWQRCFEADPAMDEAWTRARELALARRDGPRAFALIDAQIACATDPKRAAGLARIRLQEAVAWSGDPRAAWGATAGLFLLEPDAAEVAASLASLAKEPAAVEMLDLLSQHLAASGHVELLQRWQRLAVEALGLGHPFALARALQLLEHGPADADFAARVEEVVRLSGSDEQKRKLLERAHLAAPDDRDALVALVAHLERSGDAEAAQALLQRAAERAPEAAQPWRDLIALAQRSKQPVAQVVALEGLLEVPSLDPSERFDALLAAAQLYDAQLGRPDLAVARAASAARLHPASAAPLDLLRRHAASFGESGPLEEALAAACALADGDPGGHLALERLQLAMRRNAAELPALVTEATARTDLNEAVRASIATIAASFALADEALSFDEMWRRISAVEVNRSEAEWARIVERLADAPASPATIAAAIARRRTGMACDEATADLLLACIVGGGEATAAEWADLLDRKLSRSVGPRLQEAISALVPSDGLAGTLLDAFDTLPVALESTADCDALVALFAWLRSLGAVSAAVVSRATAMLEPAGPMANLLASAVFDLLPEAEQRELGKPLLEAALRVTEEQALLSRSRIETLSRGSGDAGERVEALRGLRTATTKRGERTRLAREIAKLLADQMQQPSQAADMLAEALAEEPLHLTLLEDHAAMLERAERWDDALRAVERFASAAPVAELQDDLTFRAAILLAEKLGRSEAAMALLLPLARDGKLTPDREHQAASLAATLGRWEAMSALLEIAAGRQHDPANRQRLLQERAAKLAAAEQSTLAWQAALDAAAAGITDEGCDLLLSLSGKTGDAAGAASSLSALAAAAGENEVGWRLWDRAASLLADANPSGAFALLRPAASVAPFAARATALQREIATRHGLWSHLADHLAASGAATPTALLEQATLEADKLGDRDRARATLCRLLDSEPLHADGWSLLRRVTHTPTEWRQVEDTLVTATVSPEQRVDWLAARLAIARDETKDAAATFALGREIATLAPDRLAWRSLESDARAAGAFRDWLEGALDGLVAEVTDADALATYAGEAESLGEAQWSLRLHRAAADRSADAVVSWLAVATETERTLGAGAAAEQLEAAAQRATRAEAAAALTARAVALRDALLPADVKAARAALERALQDVDAAAAAGTVARAERFALRASWLLSHARLDEAAAELEAAAAADSGSRLTQQVTGDLALLRGETTRAVTAYLAARVNQDPAADHPLLCAAPFPGELPMGASVRYAMRAAGALEALGAEDEAFETLTHGHLEDEAAEAPLLGLARLSLRRGNRDAAATYLATIRRRTDAAGEIPSAAYLDLVASLEPSNG